MASAAKPTQEQLASRAEVQSFLDRVKKPVREWAKGIKSEWFGRPDDELKQWIEYGRWWDEVKDTRWYQNQLATLDREIKFAQEELENGKGLENVAELRSYLKALRFVRGHILTTERNADISSRVLQGRSEEIKSTFIRGGLNDRSSR
jgi:hypothetical protein